MCVCVVCNSKAELCRIVVLLCNYTSIASDISICCFDVDIWKKKKNWERRRKQHGVSYEKGIKKMKWKRTRKELKEKNPSKFPGDSCDIDIVYRTVDDSPDPEHHTEFPIQGRPGQHPGQPSPSAGRGFLHNLVHARVRAAVQRLARQVEVLQGRPKRHRPPGHNPLLHKSVSGRDKHERHRPVSGRATSRTDLSDHEDPEDLEIGQALDRAPESRLHSEKLVQGARSADALPGHGGFDILESGLLCREGGAQHEIHKHSGDVLVGGHYHDHRWLRRHLPHHRVGQGHR